MEPKEQERLSQAKGRKKGELCGQRVSKSADPAAKGKKRSRIYKKRKGRKEAVRCSKEMKLYPKMG